MDRRTFLAAAAGAAGSLVAGCAGGSGGGGGESAVKETTDVTMQSSQFDPRNIAVEKGATVTWTNEDGHAHTVTAASDNWSFDGEVGGGQSVDYTFEESGVYGVYCRFHGDEDLSGMSMKVAVGDAAIEDPLGGGDGGYGGGGYG